MRWEWFKNKELGSLMIWSQRTFCVVFSPVNNCFSGKKGRVFFISPQGAMQNGFINYYELLKLNEPITGKWYRTQLIRLSRALREKLPQYEQRHDEVILQHDNASPHVANPVKTYLETLKWEVPRYCAFWLLLVPVDGTWSGWSAVDSLKRWKLLP